MVLLTLEKKEDIEDGDNFLTTEQFLSFVSQPCEENSNLKDTDFVSFYERYENLCIHYKDFPGIIREIFDKFEVVLKIRMKMTFKFIGPVNKDYNWVGFMQYNYFYPTFNSRPDVTMGSMKMFNLDIFKRFKTSNNPSHKMFPSIIFKIPGNNQIPNLNECDFVLFHSDPGYYCNLELEEMNYIDFRKNEYFDIIVDTEVLELVKNSEIMLEKKFRDRQNTVANVTISAISTPT
jgi:hypothetical protein